MRVYLIAHIGHTTKWCEHVTWWRPDRRGYTFCIEKAGLYGDDDARSICQYGNCIAVRKDEAERLARGTPYYRQGNGMLVKLYDGENHVVVPNSKKEWVALMASRMDCGKTNRPTPIGAKARAIYLPPNIRQEEGAA